MRGGEILASLPDTSISFFLIGQLTLFVIVTTTYLSRAVFV